MAAKKTDKEKASGKEKAAAKRKEKAAAKKAAAKKPKLELVEEEPSVFTPTDGTTRSQRTRISRKR